MAVSPPKKLLIQLYQESPDQVYYPGSTVSGSLYLQIDQPRYYRKVLVEIHGSYNKIVIDAGDYPGSTRTSRQEDPFISTSLLVWDKTQSPGGYLPAGEYTWPFSFTLPQAIPSSYYSRDAVYIDYGIYARVIREQSMKYEVSFGIRVQQLVKITDPRHLVPVHREAQTTVGCLCCMSSPIIMAVTLPKSGFLLGETFNMQVSLVNPTSRSLSVIATIEQINQDKKEFLCSATAPIVPGRSTETRDLTITIPNTEEVCLIVDPQQIVKVTHRIVVVCHIPWAKKFAITLPLQLANCQ